MFRWNSPREHNGSTLFRPTLNDRPLKRPNSDRLATSYSSQKKKRKEKRNVSIYNDSNDRKMGDLVRDMQIAKLFYPIRVHYFVTHILACESR